VTRLSPSSAPRERERASPQAGELGGGRFRGRTPADRQRRPHRGPGQDDRRRVRDAADNHGLPEGYPATKSGDYNERMHTHHGMVADPHSAYADPVFKNIWIRIPSFTRCLTKRFLTIHRTVIRLPG
jgi:hypothetical protein